MLKVDYEDELLINNDSILRNIKLIYPMTKYFSIKIKNTKKESRIAPGNCLDIDILFKGESKQNHLDYLTVISEKGFFFIKLQGLKEMPKLFLDNCLSLETKNKLDQMKMSKFKSKNKKLIELQKFIK